MQLSYILTTILFSIFFSFLISFPIINLLYRLKIVRKVNNDMSFVIIGRENKIGIPIMGGLIFVVTITVLNLFLNPHPRKEGVFMILVIFLLSALLGGIDDYLNVKGIERKKPKSLSKIFVLIKVHKKLYKRLIYLFSLPWYAYKSFFYMLGSNPGSGIQAHEKIIIQSIAGLILGGTLYFLTPLATPEVIKIPLLNLSLNLGILFVPFAWITMLLMTNAVNLADGMDGLVAGQVIIASVGFLIIAILQNDVKIIFLLSTTIGSLIAYLYFNIPPARFQMGDVGSLALGSLLTSVAFTLQQPLLLLIICFPFAITLLSAVIQGIGRRFIGRRIFKMAPIHYHLQLANNWTEEKVVMRLWLFSVICMLLGLFVYSI